MTRDKGTQRGTNAALSDNGMIIDTEWGPAGLDLDGAGSLGLLCLGHGAGGGVEAPDLAAVTAAAVGSGWVVARVTQPYRVAGRRAPDRAPRLDAAWVTAVQAAREHAPTAPLVVGGRSSGARVACRTATALDAAGVVCVAFPLHPPRSPGRSRLAELLTPAVPRLVVQGERDPFGGPCDFPAVAGVDVVGVPGDHSLRRSAPAVAAAVVQWLAALPL
jgi:predicted alpha/beta-hydrolase family hydrolase